MLCLYDVQARDPRIPSSGGSLSSPELVTPDAASIPVRRTRGQPQGAIATPDAQQEDGADATLTQENLMAKVQYQLFSQPIYVPGELFDACGLLAARSLEALLTLPLA